MEIVYLLIPVVLILVSLIVWVFLWAVKSDQFEDLEGPGHRIIMEKDEFNNKDLNKIEDTDSR